MKRNQTNLEVLTFKIRNHRWTINAASQRKTLVPSSSGKRFSLVVSMSGRRIYLGWGLKETLSKKKIKGKQNKRRKK